MDHHFVSDAAEADTESTPSAAGTDPARPTAAALIAFTSAASFLLSKTENLKNSQKPISETNTRNCKNWKDNNM